jgi:D-sedoheptulose 7-phosphate isomerase
MSYGAIPSSLFASAIQEHLNIISEFQAQSFTLERIARVMSEALQSGGKILWCGNGGSAADSQHLAAELVGRFRRERQGLHSIALSTNTSILTAIGNDYGYDYVFSRQVEAIANRGDVLVGISTSGNSRNVLAALDVARSMGVVTVGLTGAGGGKMAGAVDYLVEIPSNDTARIQEGHILAGHLLCDWVEIDCVNSTESLAEVGQGTERRRWQLNVGELPAN